MNVLSDFASMVLKEVETGDAQWLKPWGVGECRGLPVNGLTKKPYRGANILALLCTPFKSREWYTFKQVSVIGGKVKRGSKGTKIFFFTLKEVVVKDDEDDKEDKHNYKVPIFKAYTVFNREQIDGLPDEDATETLPEVSTGEIFRDCESLMSLSQWYEDETSAYYQPTEDEIHVPSRRVFKDEQSFWGTCLHELGHWTGHESRLSRAGITTPSGFGTQKYAREELIAELTSWLLAVTLGTPHEPQQNGAYIRSWLQDFKDKPKEIYIAVNQAQKAVDYLLNEKAKLEC